MAAGWSVWCRGKEGIVPQVEVVIDTLGRLFIQYFLSSGTRIHQGLGFKLGVVASEKTTCTAWLRNPCEYAVLFSICLQLNDFHWYECISPSWLFRDY